MKTAFVLHINMPSSGGRLCEVAYIPIPYFPLLISFTPIKGRGHGLLYPLAMPVPVVQLAFVNLGSKRGSEATEWGEGVFPLPTVGNFFVENSCMKMAFFVCTL